MGTFSTSVLQMYSFISLLFFQVLNCISSIFSESYSALLFESLGIFRVLRPWNVFRKDFGKTLQNYLCKRFLKLFQKSLESNFPERLLKNLHTRPLIFVLCFVNSFLKIFLKSHFYPCQNFKNMFRFLSRVKMIIADFF